MKKKFLAFLPLVLITSCSVQQVATNEGFTPYICEIEGRTILRLTPSTEHVTYLMCSRYGYVDVTGVPEKGKVSDKFYENTIELFAEPGTALPEAKSEVGATFRGWAYYDPSNDNVYPDYYKTVPEVSGLPLKAIFDGSTSGGGGGGGGGGTPVTESYSATIQIDLSFTEGWGSTTNYSIYLWGANGEEPLGKWDACAGNIQGSGNVKSVTTPMINYPIVGAIFYFDETSGEYAGRKQTTDMSIHISSTGTYEIKFVGSEITWNDSGLMTNFTISKVS